MPLSLLTMSPFRASAAHLAIAVDSRDAPHAVVENRYGLAFEALARGERPVTARRHGPLELVGPSRPRLECHVMMPAPPPYTIQHQTTGKISRGKTSPTPASRAGSVRATHPASRSVT